MLQERQSSRLVVHVLHKQVDETGVELTADQLGRPFNGATQFVIGHRADEKIVI
jgi:hypothetical protein